MNGQFLEVGLELPIVVYVINVILHELFYKPK